jgi:hypothetical protein
MIKKHAKKSAKTTKTSSKKTAKKSGNKSGNKTRRKPPGTQHTPLLDPEDTASDRPSNLPASEEPNLPPAETCDRGIRCPRCGCRHLRVVWTAQRKARIRRRRRCRSCGRSLTTTERLD